MRKIDVEIDNTKLDNINYFKSLVPEAIPTGLFCAGSNGKSLDIVKCEPSLCDRVFLLISADTDELHAYIWLKKDIRGFLKIIEHKILINCINYDIEKNMFIKIIKDKNEIQIKDTTLIEKLLNCTSIRISDTGVIRNASNSFESFEGFRTFNRNNVLYKTQEHYYMIIRKILVFRLEDLFLYTSKILKGKSNVLRMC